MLKMIIMYIYVLKIGNLMNDMKNILNIFICLSIFSFFKIDLLIHYNIFFYDILFDMTQPSR
jgi:hypothetical protein